MLHLENSFALCWNLDVSEIISQKYETFLNFMLLKGKKKTDLTRVNEERNILYTIKWRTADFIDHILYWICLLNTLCNYTVRWIQSKHNYKYMAKWWCLLAMEEKKLYVSAYRGHFQVLTTFLLKEFHIICPNHVVILRSHHHFTCCC